MARKDKLRHIVLREVQPIEQLYFTAIKHPLGHEMSYKQNDITLLFNQQRITKDVGVDTINKWLQSLQPVSNAISEMRKKMSDDQLHSLVKSRHIQSMSELLSWSDFLNTNYESLLNEMHEASQTEREARIDSNSNNIGAATE